MKIKLHDGRVILADEQFVKLQHGNDYTILNENEVPSNKPIISRDEFVRRIGPKIGNIAAVITVGSPSYDWQVASLFNRLSLLSFVEMSSLDLDAALAMLKTKGFIDESDIERVKKGRAA